MLQKKVCKEAATPNLQQGAATPNLQQGATTPNLQQGATHYIITLFLFHSLLLVSFVNSCPLYSQVPFGTLIAFSTCTIFYLILFFSHHVHL